MTVQKHYIDVGNCKLFEHFIKKQLVKRPCQNRTRTYSKAHAVVVITTISQYSKMLKDCYVVSCGGLLKCCIDRVADEWFWCRRLMEVVHPAFFHPRIASRSVGQASYIVQGVREHSPLTREALKR